MIRLKLDASWSRPAQGSVALGGSPLRLFRLTPGGQRVAEALERGGALPSGHEPLTDRLLEAGAVHPDVISVLDDAPPAASNASATRQIRPDVDVVIPAHDEDPRRLAGLVADLRLSPRVNEIVIVDDASTPPLAPVAGARVVRLAVNGGPAHARNTGAAATSAPFVLFVDADITSVDSSSDDVPRSDRPVGRRADLVDVLRRHLDDERAALVAPRVAAASGNGVLAAFDAVCSPLDLGTEPARVRPLSRVSYVPSAVVLVRRRALVELGGFDGVLRFGEDVDLVWRLDAAGWRCRYEPAVVARHRVRTSARQWLRQRHAYGTSAAALARRHGRAVAPLRMSRWSLAAWVVGAFVHPLAGIAIAAGSTAEFARRLGDVADRTQIALRYAGLGHLHAGRLLAQALTRTWWPFTLAAALVSRRARRVLAVAAIVPATVEWFSRRPRLDPVRFVALSLADDVAYGTGVWVGCWRARDATALSPDITR